MKEWLISNLFRARTKSTDAEFKQLRSAVEETASQRDSDAALKILRNGDVVLSVDDAEVGEAIVEELKSLPHVTVSGVSNPVEAFVKGRLQQTSSAK